MRIKRLEIHGFKSFADPARIHFGKGITGVVGPNGCGKSNIIDAIRWCMGEMSAKHLRGRAMQDVIFAGSDSRGPLGMAEVTLTFDTEGGDVPPQYAAYSEISITRRLHRDGTSEYLINNIQMRLRDITDLFLGTGVGTRAYSIIEQGRIGFIVNSRPEDRRGLIEEVAGITKFKQRKKTAERRMAATSQNLQRVRDIIAELERQLASLERQVKKAERYKRLKAEIRELDLLTAAHQLFELEEQKKSTLELVEQQTQRSGDVQRDIASMEANLEASKLALLEREEEIQVHQRRSNEADVQVVALQRDLDSWAAQRTQLMERMEEASLEIAGPLLDSAGKVKSARRSPVSSSRLRIPRVVRVADWSI